jgi:hypothetical protein
MISHHSPVSPMRSYVASPIILGHHCFQDCPCGDDGLRLVAQSGRLSQNQRDDNRARAILNTSHPSVVASRMQTAADTLDLPIANLASKFYKTPFVLIGKEGSDLRSDSPRFARRHKFMGPPRENVFPRNIGGTAKNAFRDRSGHENVSMAALTANEESPRRQPTTQANPRSSIL